MTHSDENAFYPKTMFGMQAIKEHLANGGTILYYDTEAPLTQETIDRYLCDSKN